MAVGTVTEEIPFQ